MRHIPNLLSAFRIVLIPFFVCHVLQANMLTAAIILIISALTDMLDGFLARRFNWITLVGKVLDPMADKLTQIAVCVLFLLRFPQFWVFFAVLMLKDLVILTVSAYLLKNKAPFSGAKWFGKVATSLFYVSMILIALIPNMPDWAIYVLLGATTFCAFLSLSLYIPEFIRHKRQIEPPSKMKYQSYIFDFDFTLADATTGIVASVNYALNQLGFPPQSLENIRKTIGMTLENIFFSLTDTEDKQLAEQFVSHFITKANEVMTDSTLLFDDTIDVLRTLKQANCKTAIVTNKFRYRIEDALKKYAITDLIDYIVGPEDVSAQKPSPEGLLKAVTHLKAEKPAVLYIGDSTIDAHAAKNASIDFAAVLTGETSVEDFSSLPHVYIAKNLTNLLEYAQRRDASSID